MSGSLLIYVASGAIQDFVAAHPINWKDRDLACLHGPGDQAGMPPVPSVLVFLDALRTRRDLFTQAEYWEACQAAWATWCAGKPDIQMLGLEAKAYRNFYPSMIDSIYVWAMLVEVGGFDKCYLDTVEDHTGKTDLTAYLAGQEYKIALQGRSRPVRRPRARGDVPDSAYVVALPDRRARPPRPGNKQWYQIGDFFSPDGTFCPGWHQKLQQPLGV